MTFLNAREKLIGTIEAITKLPSKEVDHLLEITHPKIVKQGSYFIREGQIPKKFGFVVNGLFRYAYIHSDGKEFTKAFFQECSFISSYTAMINQVPSFLNIEALEDAEILEINFNRWQALRASNPYWDKLLIAMLEKGYSTKEKREREFLVLNAENRYRNFIEEFPQLQTRIKQHLIASYLGITPIALSRIRKKMGLINLG